MTANFLLGVKGSNSELFENLMPTPGAEMEINTHLNIDRELCGTPAETGNGSARIEMVITEEMTVDSTGLAHGGFIFGLADHAAMLAVNHPNVVLAGADVRFLKPVRTGDAVFATATVTQEEGKKKTVTATVYRDQDKVFTGRFDCYVPDRHVLENAKS